MRSQEIQDYIYTWAAKQDFTAPYGVLTGKHTNKKGRKFLSVTFGRARTLDATVEIYNQNFMLLRTNRTGSQVFKSIDSLMSVLTHL